MVAPKEIHLRLIAANITIAKEEKAGIALQFSMYRFGNKLFFIADVFVKTLCYMLLKSRVTYDIL